MRASLLLTCASVHRRDRNQTTSSGNWKLPLCWWACRFRVRGNVARCHVLQTLHVFRMCEIKSWLWRRRRDHLVAKWREGSRDFHIKFAWFDRKQTVYSRNYQSIMFRFSGVSCRAGGALFSLNRCMERVSIGPVGSRLLWSLSFSTGQEVSIFIIHASDRRALFVPRCVDRWHSAV